MMKLGTFSRATFAMAGSLAAAVAFAQTDGAPESSGITLPTKVDFIETGDPNVRKATAIVNGDVITATDVDQRLALIVLGAQGQQIPPEEMERLRAQVLRNLVDETLQIQAAEGKDIKVEKKEIDTYYSRYARNFGKTPEQFAEYLRAVGSSEATIKRQIHGEMAWTRLQDARILPFVNPSEEEVRGIIARLEASRGTQEYRVGEIFLSATPETADTARANAMRIIEQLKNGASFQAYARQFSEASTAVVGGDLGWLRAEQLPEALSEAITQMPVGAISNPIAIPGGFSILALQDSRKVLVADARDAVLSLKQMSITFPPGTTRAQAEPKIQQLKEVSQTMGGCGRAEAAAATIGAEVVSSDQVKVRDLPPTLQDALLRLSIGQPTAPFGTFEEGVRVLVLCGRDDPQAATGPTYDDVYAKLREEGVNRRAQRYLRDLRRDAVVDYR
ncbi:MAG TPA: peptidylprolyl isomerase [Allosphingosinicella sp.]|nr:peptidylprolyl isomerase [Allosphingosinicella sp.]